MKNIKIVISAVAVSFIVLGFAACSSKQALKPKIYELAMLSAHVYEPNSTDKLPCELVCDDYVNKNLGFTAATYSNKYYKIVAFRGTKNIFDGVADIGLTLSSIFGDEETDSDVLNIATDVTSKLLTSKVKQAQDYYKKAKQNETRDIIVVGHSLGGFFAQIVGYVSGDETHTFNAPGAEKYILQNKLKPAAKINITNHLSLDVVSAFGNHVGRDTMYNNAGHSIDDFCEYLQKNQ